MNLSAEKEANISYANKSHNFLVSEAIKRILSTPELDAKLNGFIENSCLIQEKNPFSLKIPHPVLSLETALQITYNWREIIKQFTLTVLISLGELADKINQRQFPAHYIIGALQTGVTIISDDLNRVFSTQEAHAPHEPDGLHYGWWETNILKPLRIVTPEKCFPLKMIVSPKTQRLLQEMNALAKNPLGFAVQLYVIEIIAIDMILTLLTLLSKVQKEGQKVFKSSDIISWITSHLQNEMRQPEAQIYADEGIINRLTSPKERRELFRLAHNYIRSWEDVCREFHGLSEANPLDNYHEIFIAFKNRKSK